MTPKEKAQELIDRFLIVNSELVELITGEHDLLLSLSEADAKECALIAVDEAIEFEKRIIKEIKYITDKYGHAFRCEGLYWETVKQEIEKL